MKKPENFNIQSLHGYYFTAEICFTDVVGRVSCENDSILYLCHDNHVVGIKPEACKEMFGYEYAWTAIFAGGELDDSVQNFKILPSPLEYHELFKIILFNMKPTSWDVDGSYSVLPKDVVSKIVDFMEGMKIFGNNQNSIK